MHWSWNEELIPCYIVYVGCSRWFYDLVAFVTRTLVGRHTTTIFVKVGSLRTDAAIYRCEGPLAGVTLFTERAAGAATAGHTVGVLHVF